jgi:uncharacterized GH25 family protein
MRHVFGLALALVFASATLSAHDFWLAATDWRPADVATITAGLGERFPTRTTFQTRDQWLSEWRVVGEQGEVAVSTDFVQAGLEVANAVKLPSPGAYLGVASVTARTARMTGTEFTDYLKEEGLDAIVAARHAAGEAGKTTTERYARFAKIALRTGAGSGHHLTRPTGVKAEFVPAADPTSLRAGQPLTVQFLVDGTPVANATVMAVSEGVATRAQTDAGGRATFTINRPGPWLIKTIHMVRLPDGSPIEWDSFWATLTFHAGA